MKVLDGSLADSLSSRFGQFSIQKTVDSDGEEVCSYNKRTFFSWTVHCLRFRFSKAYRQNVIAERQEILSALDRSWQEQTVSASDDSHDPSKNMRSANVTLSSRRRFNSRVSELLQLDATSAEPGGTQATVGGAQVTAAQKSLLNQLVLSRHNKAGRVLRPQNKLGDRGVIKRQGAMPPYVLQFVEDSLEAGYVENTPNLDGPDKNGELCKRFLTYHTFESDPKGELEENLFKWKAVNTEFDPSQAYPTIAPDDLPGEGWLLRTPSDSSIKYAAEIADTIRGMTKDEAQNFTAEEVLKDQNDDGKQFIAIRFFTFLGYNLGNDLLLQDSEI